MNVYNQGAPNAYSDYWGPHITVMGFGCLVIRALGPRVKGPKPRV